MKKGEAEFRIALHPNWTGRGVGRKLAWTALEQGFLRLGFDFIRLIVRKNNLPARALYEKPGIEISGECTGLIKGNRSNSSK
jgi:diamine N-acetyltransferase